LIKNKENKQCKLIGEQENLNNKCWGENKCQITKNLKGIWECHLNDKIIGSDYESCDGKKYCLYQDNRCVILDKYKGYFGSQKNTEEIDKCILPTFCVYSNDGIEYIYNSVEKRISLKEICQFSDLCEYKLYWDNTNPVCLPTKNSFKNFN